MSTAVGLFRIRPFGRMSELMILGAFGISSMLMWIDVNAALMVV